MAAWQRQRLSPPPSLLLSLSLLLLLFAASGASAARNLPPTSPTEADGGGYVVVIDAGSTGSRAHIYRWREEASSSSSSSSSPPLPRPRPRPLLPEVSPAAPSLKREPGLSATEPENVAEALKPLLEHAAAHVPREHHATTDVLVLATAGLRALPRPEDREARLRAASDAVAALSPFRRPRRGAVATLRGVDEGALAWVAANAAAGTLVERGDADGGGKGGASDSALASSSSSSFSSSPPRSGGSETKRGTFGIAEIGGTSMQVTFEVPLESTEGQGGESRRGGGSGASEEGNSGPSSSPSSTADIFHLELPTPSGVALFRLFSRSWEGLGHEAARATTAAAVSLSLSASAASSSSSLASGSEASAASNSRQLDPCVPPGAVVPLPAGVVAVPPSADAAAAAAAAASGISAPSSTSGVGTGDFDACRRAASQALRLSCAARPDHCPLPSDASARIRPPPNLSGMEVLGIENLRHTANALGLLAGGGAKSGGGGGKGGGGGGRPTLREIVAAGRALCSHGGKKEEEKEEEESEKGGRGPGLGPVEAARHCFGAAYTVALLGDAFGVGLDERGVEFSGSVVAVSSASASAAGAVEAEEKEEGQQPEQQRVTPEWTSAAAALAAADVALTTKKKMKSFSSSSSSSSLPPLPFEALLRAPGELVPTRFAFHRRRHRALARLFLTCGAFAAAAVAVRSLASSSSSSSLPPPVERQRQQQRQQQQQERKKCSAAGEGSPPFPLSSVDAASDALGTGDGASPLRGGGSSKLSKRGGGGGTVDLSAEAASSSAVSPKENQNFL